MIDLTPRYASLRQAYADLSRRLFDDGCSCGPGAICCRQAAGEGLSGTPLFSLVRTADHVLDLGAGAGRDTFLAAIRVGPEGGVVGIDMTPEMVALARRNLESFRESEGRGPAEFLEGYLEELPLGNGSVDAAFGNCVVNLTLDPARVFLETARVLRPGGRLILIDLVPENEQAGLDPPDGHPFGGCLSTMLSREPYLEALRNAGFERIKVLDEESPPAEDRLDEPWRSLLEACPDVPFRRLTVLAKKPG
jgi:arsenite methyltransferase